jgi:hypothetical protein
MLPSTSIIRLRTLLAHGRAEQNMEHRRARSRGADVSNTELGSMEKCERDRSDELESQDGGVREKGCGVKVCERQTYRSVQRLQPKSISRTANCMSWFTMGCTGER